MKLEKALKEYRLLKEKKDQGKIKEKKFEKAVGKISGISEDGVQWKVDKDGNWMRNDNGEWIKDTIKIKKPPQGPQTLFQLLVLIVKGIFKNLPKKLLYFGVIVLVSFLVHTYLVVFPNGGFAMGTNKTLDKTLALVGNEARGTVFWTISAYLITSVIRRIISIGPGNFIGGIFTGPVRLVKSMFSKKGRFISVFALCTLVFLLLGQVLIKNTAIAYTLLIGAVLAIISFKFDISYLVIKLGYQDFARFFKRKKAEFNDIYFDAFQLAIIASMILYSFLNEKPLYIYLICGFMVAMYILAKFKKTNKIAAQLFVFGLAGLNIAFIYMLKAYADDGGADEVGGAKNWIGSQGSGTAAAIGLPPSIGAGVGGLIGIVTGGGDFTGPYVDVEDYSDEGDYSDTENEEVEEVEESDEEPVEESEEITEETEDDEESDDNEEDEDEYDEEDDEEDNEEDEEFIEKFEEEMFEHLEDLQDLMFGDPEDQLEVLKDWAEKGYELPGEIGDAISNGQDFVLTTDIMDKIFDTYDGLVPDWFEKAAEDTANEAWDYMGVANDLFGDYLPEGSPISGLMDAAGILKDAFDNVGMGDNVVYAGVKSFLSNKIKSLAFDLKLNNPSALPLVIMDTLVTIFAGGSDAGNILSPGKTIQGGANFIIDKLTDLYNGTDDVSKRLDAGKYGGTWKEMDNLTEFAAEAAYDPNFKKDFDNVVTSDEFYDGMYKTNEKLWKPAEGSWAIKRAGCYVGKKATEQVINVVNGVKKISSWLGSWI